MTLHPGGKIELTRTRLNSAIRASRSASSNEFSFSECFPTPLVRKIPLPTGPMNYMLQPILKDVCRVSLDNTLSRLVVTNRSTHASTLRTLGCQLERPGEPA